MAVSAIEFWQQIARIGIVDAAAIRVWNERFKSVLAKQAESSSDRTKPLGDDAVSVAQFLLANRVLTKYQSQRLLAGRGAELRLSDYVIEDRCDQAPFSRWYRARHITRPAIGFVYPCTDALTSSRWVDPEWLAPHSAMIGQAVQPINVITLAPSDPWRGAVVSELPSGRPLNQWVAEHGALDPITTATIGQALATSLHSMHEAGLVHGEVRPSRIWCGDDRSLWLLRDAGRPPVNPADPPQEHCWFDDDGAAELYAAPELADLNVMPSFTTDLYGLGAVVYELLSGKRLLGRPFEGVMPAEVLEAREMGPSGDPLLRTLAFAIDPDPQRRFPDVQSFGRALSAVIAAYGGQSPPAPASRPPVSPPPDVIAPSSVNNAQSTPADIREVTRPEPAKSPQDAPAPKRERASEVKAQPKSANMVGASKPAQAAEAPANDAATKAAPAAPAPAKMPAPSAVTAPVGLSAKTIAAPTPPVAAEPIAAPEPRATASPVIAVAPSSTASPVSSESPASAQAAENSESGKAKKPVRRRNRRDRRGPIIVGSVAVVILLGIIGVLLQPGEPEPVRRTLPLPPPRPVSSVATTPATTSGQRPATTAGGAAAASGYELIEDDRLLWVAPWAADSKAPSLEMIPPGSQAIITLRLSRILGDNGGNRLLDWLGPELTPAISELEKRAGVKASEIERLTIAAAGSPSGSVKTTYTVTLHTPIDLKTLSQAWGVSPSKTRDGKTIYSNEEPLSDVFYLGSEAMSADSTVRQFVFGPVDEVTLVAEMDGSAIPLPRLLQQLWDASSEEADLNLLTVPNFLFADGRQWLMQYAPRAIEPLRSLLIPDAAGATVAMSLVDQWYMETRFAPSGNVSAPTLLQSLKSRVDPLATQAESFAIDAAVDPSWKAMAIRLPQFMRAIADQTRYGVSQTLPTANFYLPVEAAPQVALATVLALSSSATAPVAVAEEPMSAEPMTVMQMIDHNMSVSFDQESLEFAVTAIRDEFVRSLPQGSVPPTITIIGGDLEKMGITQNQQIRNFQMRDKPLRDALSELVRQANPDKSATGLNDEKQSLVWVVDTTAAADKPTILITTRQAVAEKKLTLSKEFTGAE